MLYQPTLTRFSWSTLLLLLLSLGLGLSSCNLDDDDDEDPLGDWEQIKSGFPGVGRNAAVSFTIDNITYVGLGFDEDGERLSDFWAYNPELGYWDNLGRLSTDSNARFPGSGRNGAVAFALNGKGYVGLGDNDQDYQADFYEYNPGTRSWRKLADFPGGARRGAVAFVIGDKAYVGTGYNDNYLVDFWSYNATSDTWEPVRDFGGSKREAATAVVFNGKAYVGFGNNNGIAQKNLYVFDPQQNSWTEIESLDDDDEDQENLEARISASAFVLGNRIFFFGGSTGGYYQGDIWAYDPALDTWTEHTALTDDCGSARATTIAFAHNGVGYVTTGTGGAGRFDDLWVFSPDVEQVDCD
ncbi:MAG: galactose oxidase [Haliscomenobacter sp.]|nr:kelch repeat-containing protein [Haliscomenobacter sp.]MBK9488622.1 galactose oxidase [Haliscomenobacter sp.]